MTDTEAMRAILAKATPGEWSLTDLDQSRQIWSGNTWLGEFRDYYGTDSSAVIALHKAAPAMLDEIDAFRAENAQLREALAGVTDDEPCQYDHHGYCQTHFISNPCEMAIARATLTQATSNE